MSKKITVKTIRTELRSLRNNYQKDCGNDLKCKKINLEKARMEINKIYGKGWKSNAKYGGYAGYYNQEVPPHEDPTSEHYGHVNGQYWRD